MTTPTINTIQELISKETQRQKYQISLIASENIIYPEVSTILSSPLTNKYAEGYPSKRYYSGCKYVDSIEEIAIQEAKKTFGCAFANVQPLTGSIANFIVYQALLSVGDTILSLNLSDGGHLTHNSKASFVSRLYNCVVYSLKDGELDYEQIRELALLHKPKLIICGTSSYSKTINFQRFKEIAKLNNSYLLGDISHLSGLIVTNKHPHCFPDCDVVMTTMHKQLRGPRSAIILWNDPELTAKINKSVFPGTQGGPKLNEIAGTAMALSLARTQEFASYYTQVLKNSQAMVSTLTDLGANIVGLTTETHMFMINTLTSFNISGNVAEQMLEQANICSNRNLIAGDVDPNKPSALRLGVLWITSLGFNEQECARLATTILNLLSSKEDEQESQTQHTQNVVSDLLNQKV